MFQLQGADGVSPQPGRAGRWAHTERLGPHGEEVTAFYESVFGWTHEHDGTWRSAGNAIAGVAAVPPGWPATRPSLWVTSFAVHDLAASLARALALGASRPVRRPDGAVLLLDDQQALFGLRPLAHSRDHV